MPGYGIIGCTEDYKKSGDSMNKLRLDKKDLIIGLILIIIMALALGIGLKDKERPRWARISQEEFIDYGKAHIMISNISYSRGERIAEELRHIEGVYSLKFDNSPNHYSGTNLIFVLDFYGQNSDEISIAALNQIKDILRPYDVTIFSSIGQDNDIVADRNRIESIFGQARSLELIIPSGDYDSEIELLTSLSRYKEVQNILGLSGEKIREDLLLTEAVDPRIFADLMALDYQVSEVLYSTYAVKVDQVERIISGIKKYRVPLIDMLDFLYQEAKEGYVKLDRQAMEKLEDSNAKISRLREQFQGENYSRILIEIDAKLSQDEIEFFIRRLLGEASNYYDLDSVFLIGEDGVSYEKNF